MAKYLYKYNNTNGNSFLALFYGLNETEYTLSYVFNPENLKPVKQLNRNARFVYSLAGVSNSNLISSKVKNSLKSSIFYDPIDIIYNFSGNTGYFIQLRLLKFT